MNAYERVMGTLQRQPVDRVPVFAVLGAFGGRLTNTDLHTLYTEPMAWVAGQRALQDAFAFDLVLATFDYSAIAEAFGGQVRFFTDQAPNLSRPAARDAAEASALALPDPRRIGRLPGILAATRRLGEIYAERVPVFATIPGPGALPALLMGLDAWMDTFLFDESAATVLLDHTGRFFVEWANELLEAGAVALVVTEGMAAAEMLPRDLFVGRLLPHLRHVFAQVEGPLVFHSTDGSINPILDTLPGLPNLVGVAVGSMDDLEAARQLVGPDLLLLGNLDNLSLPGAAPDQVRAWSLQRLRTAAPMGPFVLATSGADIPTSTSPDSLHAMIAASVSYEADRMNAPTRAR